MSFGSGGFLVFDGSVVSARRTLSAGMLREVLVAALETVNEPVLVSSETSVEIFSRILSRYLLPETEIQRFVDDIRSDSYSMFRNLSKHATSCPNIGACMPDMDLRSLRVHETSSLAGQTIAEANLGSRYGITVLAVRRDTEIISIPPADFDLKPEDILFLAGPPEKIMNLEKILRGEGT